MGVRRLGTLLSLACLLLGPGVRAEAPAGQPTATRPRIGLVLGGGGARGGAHLGVLRVMEELRIPVDALAGTSMGSLVGALYAQGYSPDEIGTIIEGIPWTQTFRDAPDRQLQSFRTKQDDYLALFPFELGVGKSGVSAKAGAITGSKIDFLLRGLTLESAGLESFDQLPIPYRAVAMDLKDGEMVVLDHGDLARAMRASMSVPGVFTPVEIDGRILVDGGMARNIPVDVVRTMGVDRVLAVDVGTPPKSEVRDLSSVGVLSQTLSVLSERNRNVSRGEIGPDDFLLTPELGDFSAGDFEHIAESIAIGEAAARAHVDELRRFSVSEQEYAAFLARQRRKGRDLVPSLRIDAVEVEGVDRVPADLVRSRIRTRPGSVLDIPTLAEDIVRVWQLGDFESVGYRVDRAPEGNRLVIEAREKSWGPGYLRFGMAIRSDFQGEADFRLIGYHRRPNLNRLGAEWKTVVALGNPFEAQTEFYQPLSAGGWWFVAPRWDYTRDKRETYLVDGTYEVLKTAESGAGLDFGVQLRNHGEIRVGATLGDIRIVPSTTSSHTEDDRDTGGLRVQVAVDKLDDPFFPTRGHRTLVRYFASREGLGADDAFDRLQVETQQAWTRGRNTFVGKVELGSDLGSDLPYYAQFELGGFMQLSGYERGELWGDVKLLVSLADYWKVADLGALGPFYAGAALQAGDAWLHEEDVEVEEMQTSLTLFGAFSTKLAPVFLGVGFGEEGRRSGYLVVGRAF